MRLGKYRLDGQPIIRYFTVLRTLMRPHLRICGSNQRIRSRKQTHSSGGRGTGVARDEDAGGCPTNKSTPHEPSDRLAQTHYRDSDLRP